MAELYTKLEVLNPELHKNLKFKPPEKMDIFKDLNNSVILVTEFSEAAKFYPIVFMGGGKQGLTPVVILGVEKNNFIDENGAWKRGCYIPAFVRRYPFILVEDENINKEAGERKVFVAIDRAYEGFNEEEGERLFDDEGKETGFLRNLVQFLLTYDRDYQLTMEFVKTLEELDLLQGIEATVKTETGNTVVIKNLYGVEERRLNQLKPEDVDRLFRRGFLGAIYAHLMSLSNLGRIV